MFSTEMMMQLILKIKDSIILPETSYFIRNKSSISICYSVDGRVIYINLPNKEAAAKFLKENGVVDDFKTVGDQIELYRKSFYYTSDHKQRPVMIEHMVPVAWDEIKLSKNEVQLFAARDVWSRVSKGESSYGNSVYPPISNQKFDA